MNLSFKNRIALNYMLATAGIILLLFFAIYYTVKTSMYYRLDSALQYEALKHVKEVSEINGELRFHNKAEWLEREHREAEVHPVFIQVVDENGELCDKSPNLKEAQLPYTEGISFNSPYNTFLGEKQIRAVQISIEPAPRRKAVLIAAMSLEDARMVLHTLKNTLLLAFPLVLFILFFSTRLLAGRSIQPVITITKTTQTITRNNLSKRIPLPNKRDELYQLTSSINELLERLEQAFWQEKQFTAEVSHELRTPLSVLKGTFEVLLRRKRSEEEYIEKIRVGIKEIDRLSRVVEHLLLLARMEKGKVHLQPQWINTVELIEDVLLIYRYPIKEKRIEVVVEAEGVEKVYTDKELLQLIFDNILSNAVKYSSLSEAAVCVAEADTERERGESLDGTSPYIRICIKDLGAYQEVRISDNGPGIAEGDYSKIFVPFFRSKKTNRHDVPGYGLGLSIVKKACELLQIKLSVEGGNDQGAVFSVQIPKRPYKF